MSRKKTKNKNTAVREKYISPLEQESSALLQCVRTTQTELSALYPRLLQEDLTAEAEAESASLKRTGVNLSKALKQTCAMRDELSARALDVKQQRKKNILVSAPANASIDLEEQSKNHFAGGLNIYKLLLIGYIGSFFGVIIEMLWCLITNGYIESRAGLVYGPFNILYGAGAVLLTVCLYKFRNRGAWISFTGGILVGSVVEYICSWGQELVLGTRSWDYSNMPFNINGRICLLYSIFWGFLGVLWIKNIYPRMAKWILKIPEKAGKIAVWVILAFFIVNMAMSGISLYRWSERTAGIEPSNTFWEVIDERFPDERMERIYANMEFTDSE